MTTSKLIQKTLNLLAYGVCLVGLSGCLGDKEDAPAGNIGAATTRISGSVGDGPVVGAQLVAIGIGGNELSSFESNANATFNIVIEADPASYPITIESTGGVDLVTSLAPDFDMQSAVLAPQGSGTANVNPFSTITVQMARNMSGGLTAANLNSAQDIVTAQLNSGLTGLVASGVIETPINENNIAEIVRASETLSESIRRTRDVIAAAGTITNGNSIVTALAADLMDEVVDGRGSPGLDQRLSAVSIVVYSQVLIESMANELRVNGSNASAAMESAIDDVAVSAPTTRIADLLVTPEMVAKARIGLAAAYKVDADPRIAELHGAVSGLQSGMNVTLVRSVLPADYQSVLQDVLVILGGADAATLAAVNEIARGNGDLDPATGGPDNRAPTISGVPAADVEAGAAYSFTPDAADPDGDELSFSIINQPAWATFNEVTGQLSGDPVVGDVGVYSDITISVSDGQFTTALPSFAINVFSGNAAPSISGTPVTAVTAGQGYVFAPAASDPNGDTLTFSIVNKPVWSAFNSSNGRLTGAPTEAHVGSYPDIVVSVSDGEFSDSLPAFSITVETAISPNAAPVISGTPANMVVAGSSFSFTPGASDADGDALTFSVVNQPAWATFNTLNGQLSGTPLSGDVGVYGNITITVSDGQASDSLTFSIEVVEQNVAPVIQGAPAATVTAGESYVFVPTASDANGDTLTFSISNKPAWASFNTATGRLSGTPIESQVGSYPGISISVSDGALSASLPAFTITVETSVTPNSAPVISGNPASEVTVGSAYSFVPTASDADGDALTFSITNQPGWADFDTATGHLSGTPGEADVNVYNDIRITVSDGTDTSSLQFSITVNTIVLGSATLSWTPPTEYEDGSNLGDDLAGFKIYWGTVSGNYPNSVTINNASVSTYTVDNLAPGTYEFVATSFNAAGVESVFSSPATKTIQ
jgi:hypothetical protein